MRSLSHVLLTLALTMSPLTLAAQDSSVIRLSGAYRAGPRPALYVLGGPGLDSVRAIIARDLLHSDRFELPLPDSLSRLSSGFNPELLKGSRINWVVELQPAGDGVEVRVHDIARGQVIQQRSFLLDRRGAGEARLPIHRVSDSIVGWTTGGTGIAATRILYQQNPMGGANSGLFRVDADGENRVRIPTGGWPLSPAWSPNGAYIAYSEISSESVMNIVIMTLASGNKVRLAKRSEDRLASFYFPVFSANMKELYFTRSAEGSFGEIFRASISNLASTCCIEPRTATGRRGENTKPTLSPNGSTIAFETTRAGLNQIYRMDSDGTQAVPLLAEGSTKFHAPAWSPDGVYLAYEREDTLGRPQIWVMELASGRQTALTSRDRNEWPSWAPDSRHLVFRSNRSGVDRLYVIDLESKNLRPLNSSGGGGTRYPAWSPILPETTNH